MASEKVLHNKAFLVASNPQYDAYQRGLVLMVYTFFNKKDGYISTHAGTEIGISENQQLVNELCNLINSKSKKCKVY